MRPRLADADQGLKALLLLVFLVFSIPHIQPVHEMPIPSFYSEWASFFIATLLLLLFALKFNFWEPERSYLTCSALAVALLATLTAFQSLSGMLIYPTAALLLVAVIVIGVAISAVGVRFQRLGVSSYALDAVTAALIFAAIINVVAALSQMMGWQFGVLGVSQLEPPRRLDGLIGQPNHLGTLCVMGVIGAWWWSERCSISRWWWLVIIFLLALGVAGSASRIALVSLVVSWIAALIFSVRSGERDVVKFGVALAAGFLAFFVYECLKHEVTADVLRLDTIDVRIGYFSTAWEIFKANPVFGVGFEGFAGAKFAIDGVDLRNLTTTHSHNIFTQLMAEWGIFGLLLGLVLFGSWCMLAANAFRSKSKDKALVALLTLSLWLHSSVEYPLWYVHWIVIYLFLMAIGGEKYFFISSGRSTKKALVALWGLMALISVLSLTDYRRIERLADQIDAHGGFVVGQHVRNDVGAAAALTFFQAEADLLLARTLEVDPLFLDFKMQITEETLRYRPTAETIARRILFLVYVGANKDAGWLLKKLERGGEMHKRAVLRILGVYASMYPGVLDGFYLGSYATGGE